LLTISSASPAGTRPGLDEPPVIAWDRLLDRFTDLFRRPSSALFLTLVTGWVLWPGHRTVTRMVDVADPDGVQAHDAYHRFLRGGMAELWRQLAPLLVSHLGGHLRLIVDLETTSQIGRYPGPSGLAAAAAYDEGVCCFAAMITRTAA